MTFASADIVDPRPVVDPVEIVDADDTLITLEEATSVIL